MTMTMNTDATITAHDILIIRGEAAERSDSEQVAICDRALDGEDSARSQCILFRASLPLAMFDDAEDDRGLFRFEIRDADGVILDEADGYMTLEAAQLSAEYEIQERAWVGRDIAITIHEVEQSADFERLVAMICAIGLVEASEREGFDLRDVAETALAACVGTDSESIERRYGLQCALAGHRTEPQPGINPLQWERSLALASASGHGWSMWADDASRLRIEFDARDARDDEEEPLGSPVRQVYLPVRPIPESWDAARVAFAPWDAWRCRAWGIPIAGIAPSPEHTTPSGRTTWIVAEDGTATIEIHRPLRPEVEKTWDTTEQGWRVRRTDDRGDVVVVRGILSPDGELTIEYAAEGAVAEPRHWQTLVEHLSAIADDATIWQTLDESPTAIAAATPKRNQCLR